MSLKEMSLFAFLTIFALSLAVQAAEKEDLLSGTLRVIFANIFKPTAMSVSVIVNISGHDSFNINQEILDKVMLINKNIQVPVAINQYTALDLVNFIHAKLIFTNSAENIRMRVENLFHNNEIQSVTSKYVIVLNTQDSMRENLIVMHDIFQDFFNFYIIDVIILVYDESSLHMYSYKPYSSKHCAFTKPVLLQRFERVPEFLLYHDLFPVKTKNFHKCPLKVVLWNIPPFMELTYENNLVNFKGFDAKVLKNLAAFLNFSIEIIPNDPQSFIGGEVFQNKTTVGVFKLLLERKANLTIGYIGCKPLRLQLTTGSSPYFISKVLIMLKNSKRYFKLKQGFLKLFKLQWLLLIFLLRISYEGSIFQAIRKSPYQHLPLTIDEVVQQNYSLITDYANGRLLNELTLLKNITTIVPGNPQTVLESIDDLPLKTGVLSSDNLVAIFMKGRLGNISDYAIVRDKVFNTMSCAYFPRLSFMAPMVNSLFKQYGMFGIFYKFGKELGLENLPMTTDHLRRRYSWNPQTALDLALLNTVFRCYAVMNVLAALTFVLELLSLHCNKLKWIFTKIFV
ncbi:uncharacterized protein LOC135958338 [Calliphora vicina]|uniref:uncharacterized protein LOC135958338 n=1 Tax=Calliphora vicina TaxID=7373 RepID=UPI00325C1921